MVMSAGDLPKLSFDDLKKHDSESDCWIAVHSKIYDVTSFLNEHPGGSGSASTYPIEEWRLLTRSSHTKICR